MALILLKKCDKLKKEESSERNEKLENFKNAFQDDYMKTSWFKYQLASLNGVDCSEGAYTNTNIYSHSIKTEAPFLLLECSIHAYCIYDNLL